MIQAFQSYIATNKLFTKKDKLLVAVSGGRDSMVLLDLLLQLGYNLGVAHVNYQLREEDSFLDEQFVAKYCEKYSLPLYIYRPDIQYFKEENGVSTQMAARTLRYEWFEKIRRQNNYHYILTAHHAADSVETILLHLTRGTGLAGLQGILPVQGLIRRPLLFATRETMQKYILDRKIAWRDDLSNFKTDYARNKIRLEVIPLLEKINPAFQQNLVRMAKFVQLNAQLVQIQVADFLNQYKISTDFNEEIIAIDVLREQQAKELILFEWLHSKGFGSRLIEDLADWLDVERTQAKFFDSSSHRLSISRNELILIKKTAISEENEFYIEAESLPTEIQHLSFSIQSQLPENYDSNSLYIDLQKVCWPLKVRKWKIGDKMCPFGMKGRKKISDILIDQKVPIVEKSRIFVLEDGKGEIVWLIGKKQSDKARVYPNTQRFLQVKRLG